MSGKMACPVCAEEKTIQAVYNEWDDQLDIELCKIHRYELDKMALEEDEI